MTATGARPAAAVAGDRRAGRVAAVVCLLGALAVLIGLLVPRDYFTGTNSVRARGYVIEVAPKQKACIPRIFVPAGTARIQMQVLTGAARPEIEATIRIGAERFVRVSPFLPGGMQSKVEWPIPRRPAAPEATEGSICLKSLAEKNGPGFVIGGTNGAPVTDPPPTYAGKPMDVSLAVWYLPKPGAERTLLSMLPDVMARAALFRPGWVGAWTPWLLVFLVVPLLGFAALRLMARGPRGRVPAALAVALVAFGNAAAWATLTPPLDAPDEPEHAAYAQYFAETGKAIHRFPIPGQSPYSADETAAIQAMRALANNEPGDGRPPWLAGDEQRWRERVERERPRRDDGGGFTVCCNPHSPVYYALLSPAYHAAGDSFFTKLWAMRLMSALLAAIAAACAFGIVRELVPDRPELAVAGGILVAFEPMFAFMGGSVNNDMGVNAGSAVVLYLLIRGLRRGLTWRLGLALGAALAITPLLKGTGYALFPIALFALVGMLWRRHRREHWVGAGALVALLTALTLVWRAVAASFDTGTFTTPGGTVPGEGLAPLTDPTGYLSYVWQIFLPRLPFMAELWKQAWPFYDIYVVRGWGAFGWYQVLFPGFVYTGIVAALGLMVVLGIAAIARFPASAWGRVWEALVLLGAGAAVIGGVEAFYYTPFPRGDIIAEMGRYAFPAISAFAALAIAACYGAGRARASLVAAGLAAAMVALNTAGQLVMLGGLYT